MKTMCKIFSMNQGMNSTEEGLQKFEGRINEWFATNPEAQIVNVSVAPANPNSPLLLVAIFYSL